MRALFIGAHPDDIEISAGGTIQTMLTDSWDVTILINGHSSDERRGEAVDAATILGVHLACIDMSYDRSKIAYLEEREPWDLIVTTPMTDTHPSHREAAELGLALARGNTTELWQMNHAIPGGICPSPQLNHFVTFGLDESLLKGRAIGAHKSQVLKYGPWWLSAIRTRDHYYGMMHNRERSLTYAEGFTIVKS